MTANLNSLGSVCEEIQYPIAECITQAKSAKFDGKKKCSEMYVYLFIGHCIECDAINNSMM